MSTPREKVQTPPLIAAFGATARPMGMSRIPPKNIARNNASAPRLVRVAPRRTRNACENSPTTKAPHTEFEDEARCVRLLNEGHELNRDHRRSRVDINIMPDLRQHTICQTQPRVCAYSRWNDPPRVDHPRWRCDAQRHLVPPAGPDRKPSGPNSSMPEEWREHVRLAHEVDLRATAATTAGATGADIHAPGSGSVVRADGDRSALVVARRPSHAGR